MKKIFTLVAVACASLASYAQHVEWTPASLPATIEDGVAAGYANLWDSYLATPANHVLIDDANLGVKAYFEHPTLIGKSSNKCPYNALVPLMGMNNSTRDGIIPDFFAEGIGLGADNQYVRTNNGPSEGITYTDAIVTLEIAETALQGMITLTYNRGGNNFTMYVVDATKNYMVLQSNNRCPDGTTPASHVSKFGVNPGHKYYIIASEKQSVELFKIEYDAVTSPSYEQLITKDKFPVYWDASSLPATIEDGVAAGYANLWDSYLATPANHVLIDDANLGVKAYFEHPTLIGKSSNKCPYNALVPLMGMNNSTRDGIIPDFFAEGIGLGADNQYVRTNNGPSEGITYTDAIVTLEIAETALQGKFAVNFNRGGNNMSIYVVDATKNYMVVQSNNRCPDGTEPKTHTIQFGVNPGHKYYILSSEKQSVELFAIGYCSTASENYYNEGTTAIELPEAPKAVKALDVNAPIYNLAGQRVTANFKGIVLQNGQKYILR